MDYLFVLGNPFDMSCNLVVYTVYTMIIKKAINDCVHVKEKDTPSFVPRESFMHLLEPVTRIRPYMYERFVNGTLCQVSGETYALRLSFNHWNVFLPFFHKDNNDNIRNTIENDGSYSVFIQKGKAISTKGCMVEVPQNYGYGRSSHVHTLFDLFKLHHSSNPVPKKYTLLDSDLEGTNHPLKIIFERPLESVKMIVECKRINYSYSLEFSVRLMGHDVDYSNIDFRPYEYFNQPLTLAYI
ncbi:uncharacterized protein EV154DRAFT_486426 [Mucor mucedo]|uniref:uncharacterized protein n=1 Tax=Mucor mucedo TaxID=29922 RepID=UPI00221F2D9E|nr:uncharacterized protein EV154DRAFT_486426 [Mucor mucedo]KAI7876812.1 hypothetical protein EV154DRAFT_486426 [Mucor mucedo]